MKTQTLCDLWGKAHDGATGEEKEGALDAEFVPANVARGLLEALKPFACITLIQGKVIGLMTEDFERAREAIAAAEAE